VCVCVCVYITQILKSINKYGDRKGGGFDGRQWAI
jgi:hypothetical protein